MDPRGEGGSREERVRRSLKMDWVEEVQPEAWIPAGTERTAGRGSRNVEAFWRWRFLGLKWRRKSMAV